MVRAVVTCCLWLLTATVVAQDRSPRKLPADQEAINKCFAGAMNAGIVSFQVRVGTDGTVVAQEFPASLNPAAHPAFECWLRQLRFEPALHDGLPAEAWVNMTFNMASPDTRGDWRTDWTRPTLQTAPEELAALSASCRSRYPGAETAPVEVPMILDLSKAGIVLQAKPVRRDVADDNADAARCIASKLRFSPLLRDGRKVRSLTAWTVTLPPS